MKDREIALYDLGTRPASFDFAVFLALAKTCGAKHVRFVYGQWKKKNYGEESAQRRFDTIIKPLCALYGISYSIGEPRGVEYSHFVLPLIQVHQKHGSIAKIEYPVDQGEYVTVTLRKSRYPLRDSDETQWIKFSETIKERCIFVNDYDEEPISLDDRMALYANAKMNFFVPNGPAMLCILSEAPYVMMRTIGADDSPHNSAKFMGKIGITPGFQYPWANKMQHLSYRPERWTDILDEFNLSMELERIAA